MNNSQLFNDLGISPISAISIMESLDLSTEDLSFPQNFVKLKHVIDFLKDYSEDTQRFLIRKATLNKQNKLKCMDEYCDLLSKIKDNDSILGKIKDELEVVLISNDEDKIKEVKLREEAAYKQSRFLRDEIAIYHK